MIILKNTEKAEVQIKSESPFFLYYSFLIISLGSFSYIVRGGLILLVGGILLLIAGARNSKKEDNFKEFYKLPSQILLLGVLIFLIFCVIFLIAGDFGLVIIGTYLDIETLISINLILQLSILISLIASLLYSILTGRKKEVGNYLSKGYKISNFNELNKKELKIVNSANRVNLS